MPIEKEILEAINNLKKNKSPGIDDIVSEFYQIYWNTIKNECIQVIQEIFTANEMSTTQYKGIITLVYKQGEREDLSNWRPLTLLNNDYKIITKIIAERLKTILPKIHPDQKGFVKRRNIEESIRL